MNYQGPDVGTGRGSRGSRGRDRLEDALMLTWKMEEGAWAKVWRQLFSAERQETGFSLSLQKGPSPNDTLILAKYDPFGAHYTQNCKRISVFCVKPLSLGSSHRILIHSGGS